MPLRPENKDRWLKALRSGKYPQASGYLYNKNQRGYCCIGVYAAINGWKNPIGFGYEITKDGDAIQNNGQAEELQFYLFPIELTEHEVNTLMRLNDRGVDFPSIADYIEKNL